MKSPAPRDEARADAAEASDEDEEDEDEEHASRESGDDGAAHEPAEHEAAPISSFPAATPAAPTPARRAFGALLGFLIVVGVFVGFKLSRWRAHAKPPAPVATATQTASAPAVDDRPTPPPPPEVVETSASAAPSSSTTVASASSADVDDLGDVDVKKLSDEALALLKEAKNPEAIERARAALEKDPNGDAMPYLVLGSALQDTGHWREATRIYGLCAKNAKRGMLDECRAMLRRK